MLGFLVGLLFAAIGGAYAFHRTHNSIWNDGYEAGLLHGQQAPLLDSKTAFDVSPFDEGWACGYEEGFCRAARWSARWKGIAKYYRAQRDGRLAA